MNHSATVGLIAAALSKAQRVIKGAVKDSTNPFYKSSYADLASVQDAIRDPLADNELAVVQGASSEGARVTVTTMLAHSSGEWFSSALSATAKDESPQSLGSCVSYLRRYGISSLIGVAQIDDDSESAQPRPATPAQRIVAAAAKVDDKQALLRAQRIKLLIARHGEGFRSFCKDTLGREVSSGKDLTDADIDRLEASADDVE